MTMGQSQSYRAGLEAGRRVRKVSRILLASSILGMTPFSTQTAAFAQSEPAASASQTISFNIPPQQLASALDAFIRQSGWQISYSSALVRGKQSAGIRGSTTAGAALHRLVAGTGIAVTIGAPGSAALVGSANGVTGSVGAGDSTALETIMVEGENAWGPVDGVVATRSGTGTKTDTPIEEIPQTVNVVTAAEITTRGAKSVAQALRYTPGVSVSGYTESYMIADEAVTRGFSPSSNYLDGAFLPYPGSLGGSLQIDPFLLERVEVLKGPASVLYGQNEPGGIVNMVTKRPSETPLHEVRLSGGTYGRAEAAVDFAGPVTDDKTLLYRFVGLGNLGDEQIDFTKRSRMMLAPSLTWQPDDQTSLTLTAQYQRDNDISDYQALPYIGTVVPGPDGRYIDRDLFTGERGWNDYGRDQYILGAELTHEFSDDLKLKSTVRYLDVQDQYRGMYPWWFASVGGVTDYSKVTRVKLDWVQHNSTFAVDNNLTYTFDTGPVAHTLLAGVDYRFTRLRFQSANGSSAVNELLDLYDPDYSLVSPDPTPFQKYDNSVQQVGLYVQDQLEWNKFVMTLGGRYDWTQVENQNLPVTIGGASTRVAQNDGAFTGRIGLNYLFDNGVSPYASYTESFVPQVGTDYYGDAFQPVTGRGYEIGVKYQPVGTNALLTLSAFDITKQNTLMTDYEHANLGSWSVQTGEVRSRGIEFEAKAEVLPGWNVIAGVSYVDAEYVKDDWYAGNKIVLHSPRTASLWTNYTFQTGALEGLDIGAGIRWNSRKFANSANTLETPSYYVVDAALNYDFGNLDHELKGLSGSVNVTNLFDEKYVSRCNYDFGCYYGKARTITASLSYKW